jgi:hypothetical protein
MKLVLQKSVKRLLVLWVLLLLPLSSFSYEFGYTSNAALYGNTWKMNTGTLGISAEEGLDISGVLYNYTTVKNVVDDFTVTIESDKVGGGYVFQEEHDWDGQYSGTVQNVIPLPYTPIEQFGDGRIRGTGTGSIEDVTILYMYRWDLCRNAQNDESCPNYIPPLPVIPKIEIYDALDDEFVKDTTETVDDNLLDKKEEKRETEEEDEERERLEIAMAATENALTIANTASQASILKQINTATNINSYYVAEIQGGMYRDSTALQGGKIVDNKKALRSLGQDKLMNEMIGDQYK